MALHTKTNFENQTLILDGEDFVGCELKHCMLVFKGHRAVRLEHCHLQGCTWQFEDAALRTVELLKGLYLSGPAGKQIVQSIFERA